MENIILNTDSYKASHWRLYPPGTEKVYCYIESRGGQWPDMLFFGLQRTLCEIERCQVWPEEIDEAAEIFKLHQLPFNREGWTHIWNEHGGKLPVTIKAVPEGTVLPTKNVLVTIENTDPACYWLPTYLETMLLRSVWYPSTVATNSMYCKRTISYWLNKTCDNPDSVIAYKLHDFGARGVSSLESAAIGGLAHLVNFSGSDTVPALYAGRNYYAAEMAGTSIPAMEHSTVIAWGKDHEADAYRNAIAAYGGPGKMVACVSDSYDLWAAIEQIWCGELKELVQTHGGTVVLRPDSGDPEKVVLRVVEMLGKAFGWSVNHKGYKVLPDYIKVIQGDGVHDLTIARVLTALAAHSWSAENVGFGMGGRLLQHVDRDQLNFAMKPSSVTVNGEERAVWKSPVDDPGKASRAGRLMLAKTHDVGGVRWWTVTEGGIDRDDELVEVFRDGEVLKTWTFDEVRLRAAEGLNA